MREKNPLKKGDIVDDLICLGKELTSTNPSPVYKYRMKCLKCGREKLMLSSTIRRHSGTTHKACGKGLKTKDPVFYSRWEGMRTRTTNKKYHASHCYSEKGINSDCWKYFIDFYDDMYDSFIEAVKEYGEDIISLDRINNDKSYCKENCRWVPLPQQGKNTSKIVKFEVQFPDGHKEIHSNMREFSKKYGLNENCIHDCMNPNRPNTQHKNFKFKRL